MRCMHAHPIQTLGWFEGIVSEVCVSVCFWMCVCVYVCMGWIFGLPLQSRNHLPSQWPVRRPASVLCKLNIRLGEKLGRLTSNPHQTETNNVCTQDFSPKKDCIMAACASLIWSFILTKECRHYLIVVQRVFLDEGLDEFFRSDVTQSLLRRKQKGKSTPCIRLQFRM